MDIDGIILTVLQEMTKIQAALKAWKAPVTDLFNDNRFFNSLPDEAESWKPVIKSLFDSDKTAFPELLCEWNNILLSWAQKVSYVDSQSRNGSISQHIYQ